MLDFIRQNEERCEFFAKFFQAEVDIKTNLKVDGKDVAINEKARAIDWVAWQYPGNGANGFANKFQDEFVNLHDDVNGRKMLVSSKVYYLAQSLLNIASYGPRLNPRALPKRNWLAPQT